MTDRQETAYQLIIADWIFKDMGDNPYLSEVKKALDTCWDWLMSGRPSADDLYDLLDDRTGFGGLFILMQMDEQASEAIWDIVFNACAKVTLIAYEAEGLVAPGLIENANDDEVNDFFEKTSDDFFIKSAQIKANLKQHLSNQDQIDRQELLAYFEDLINRGGQ